MMATMCFTRNDVNNGTELWSVKYHPKSVLDLCMHHDILKTIKRLLVEFDFPHLLFYGPAGTGKSCTIALCAKQYYSICEYMELVLEYDVCSNKENFEEFILQFINNTKKVQKSRLIIIKYVDLMEIQYQFILKNLIERYSKSIKFCLIGRKLQNIIPSLQFCCTKFRFPPISKEAMNNRIKHIAFQENINISEKGVDALIKYAQGDLRSALNILQNIKTVYTTVTETTICELLTYPKKTDVAQMLKWMLTTTPDIALQHITNLKDNKNISLKLIIEELFIYIKYISNSDLTKIHIMSKLKDIHSKLTEVNNENIFLPEIIGAFYIAQPSYQP